MPNETPEVTEFLQDLAHPLKGEAMKVRAAILASDDEITEHIKFALDELDDLNAELPTVVELVGR